MNDHDFPDTISAPRRQTMPFEPESWRAAHAASEIEDSDFGAFDGLVQARNYILIAWAIIAAGAVVAYLIWW